MSPTSRATWLRPMARAFLAGGMGISDQLLPPSYGEVTGTSQYALELPICVPAWAAPTRGQPFPRLSTWSPDDIRRVPRLIISKTSVAKRAAQAGGVVGSWRYLGARATCCRRVTPPTGKAPQPLVTTGGG